jgi:L-histidine Nalpha-methyltransferase
MSPLDGLIGQAAKRCDHDDDTDAPRRSAAKTKEECVFLNDVMSGLRSNPKKLSPKYFYDREGSLLFDAICDLPEYYVTRTELSILDQHVDAIASAIGSIEEPCRVVEPGAGSSTKTRLLLHTLGKERCVEYVPVDIAGEHLEHTAAALREELPWLRVTPYAGDFSVDPLTVPESAHANAHNARTVIYFPGSTLGNFDPEDARRLLARFRRAAGPDGLVLLGVDLKKDPAVLHAAYNDAQGVTAAFNKNVLRRMNEELGADFDLDAFDHYAFYSPIPGRIEMHLVSARTQSVKLGGETFRFEQGESLCTEHSYKFDLHMTERLARSADLTLVNSWLDEDRRFAVLLLRGVSSS